MLDIFSNNQKIDYVYLTNIAFIFIVLIVNIFINFYKKIQIKGSLNNLLLFITSQILIWLSVVAISILNNNAFIITLNVFFASLASIALLVVFLIRNKKINIVMLIINFWKIFKLFIYDYFFKIKFDSNYINNKFNMSFFNRSNYTYSIFYSNCKN